MSSKPASTIACPGQKIASTSTHISGSGTHVVGNDIYASIVGSIVHSSSSNSTPETTNSTPKKTIISISNGTNTNTASQPSSIATVSDGHKVRLPEVNSIVLARITQLRPRQANISILLVLDPSTSNATTTSTSITTSTATHLSTLTPTSLSFPGIIRREDIRAVERDRVVIPDMFRVGDIVRGEVISLGDREGYYVSTAGDEMGVVMARSEAGGAMVPVNWREMRDVGAVGGVEGRERRKVARPV